MNVANTTTPTSAPAIIPIMPPVVIPVEEEREEVDVVVGARLLELALERGRVPEENAWVPPVTTVRESEVEVTTEAMELEDRAGTVTVRGALVVRRLAVLAIVLDCRRYCQFRFPALETFQLTATGATTVEEGTTTAVVAGRVATGVEEAARGKNSCQRKKNKGQSEFR